ncbi:MAG: CinA family nicotinamide mononucleotide deamidase-related protein [Desulfuromonadales bacterium]|nr:CinA family nicotinamide mononucleotide deamidase-related protein [Desulfuromonadales bacterium]
MNIAILTIGDELLNGDLTDTNTTAIARTLLEHSLPVHEASTVGDNEEDIVAALQRLASTHDVVITTGGLGPTDDDRTTRAAARAFERPLSLNDKALTQIRAHFSSRQREMHPRNEKQALLPGRSTVIANPDGTAPGFHLQSKRADLYFLPGVPPEMLAMLDEYVIPSLLKRFPNPPARGQRVMSVFGLSEPEVEARINGSNLPDGVELAFNVDFPMVQVKLRARGENVQKLLDRAELSVQKALGDHVVGIDSDTLAGTTARILSTAGLTISLAESCTGGLIAKLLTDQPGSSAFLERSIVTYANSAKVNCLHVARKILDHHGAVSAECATAMAKGVHATAHTDISLAVTGIAGPGGGTVDKPVGTVYLAMTSPWQERVERFNFSGNRDQVRLRTACTALDWLRRLAMSRLSGEEQER